MLQPYEESSHFPVADRWTDARPKGRPWSVKFLGLERHLLMFTRGVGRMAQPSMCQVYPGPRYTQGPVGSRGRQSSLDAADVWLLPLLGLGSGGGVSAKASAQQGHWCLRLCVKPHTTGQLRPASQLRRDVTAEDGFHCQLNIMLFQGHKLVCTTGSNTQELGSEGFPEQRS